MKYFLDTTETIPGGVGFSHFGPLHLIWLVAFVLITVLCCIWYRKSNDAEKKLWRQLIALLLIADEIFKDVMLIIGGRFRLDYLPLHLCSINIILIAVHAWKPSRLLSGYLYTVGIPGAMAALLFPSWSSLPLANFMHIHSFTVHILLALYPIVLGVAGDLKPEVKRLPQYLLLLVGMAIPIYVINLLLNTNFMFLMSADEGNPLYLFEQMWGNHIYGFPVLITAVLIVMYVPLVIFRKMKSK
jgi:hypothetical integral membrane protein (TIGR02206 family)